eukprot:TRINITY_DN11426_c0_g1_i4.p1 TRINITY_DN11426_c0_g1~~TRINITY_DN11426_c0_g1_i4.p1  ORF type:complete len:577 (-),score=112.22 TRINITY_DN11426_c0_g1_i4:222-1952(-)
MCIRDRYQRRVHGDAISIIKEQQQHMGLSQSTFWGYEIKCKLASRPFSEISLAVCKRTREQVVIKRLFFSNTKDKEQLQAFERRCLTEIELHRKIFHPNILRFIDARKVGPYKYDIVLEYCSLGDLKSYTAKHFPDGMPEAFAREVFQQVISALWELHINGIVHRDLTPTNIFLSRAYNRKVVVKIGDLGISKNIEEAKDYLLTSHVGTSSYRAPETYSYEGYGPSVDIFTLGVTFYEMLQARRPFESTQSLLYHAQEVRFEDSRNVLSMNVKDLLTRMLIVDPRNRITLHEIKEHPWLREKQRQGRELRTSVLGEEGDDERLTLMGELKGAIRVQVIEYARKGLGLVNDVMRALETFEKYEGMVVHPWLLRAVEELIVIRASEVVSRVHKGMMIRVELGTNCTEYVEFWEVGAFLECYDQRGLHRLKMEEGHEMVVEKYARRLRRNMLFSGREMGNADKILSAFIEDTENSVMAFTDVDEDVTQPVSEALDAVNRLRLFATDTCLVKLDSELHQRLKLDQESALPKMLQLLSSGDFGFHVNLSVSAPTNLSDLEDTEKGRESFLSTSSVEEHDIW